MKLLSVLLISTTLLYLAGCSSSQTSDDGSSDEVPSADAGTDAVPQASAENPDNPPPAPGDPNAPATPPPTDANTMASDSANPPPAQPDTPAAAPTPLADASTATPAAAPTPDMSAPPAETASTATATATGTTAESSQAQNTTPPATTASNDSASSGSGGTTYKVQNGDTLMKIAYENYGDLYKWKQIYEDNKDKIKDPNSIDAGTVLTLNGATSSPPEANGEKYLIKKGDTLGTISNDVYGTPKKWKKIWKNNRQLIKDPNRIFAGFYLYYIFGDQDKQELQRNRGTNAAPLAEQDDQSQQQAQAAQPVVQQAQPQVVQPVVQQAQPQQQAQQDQSASPQQANPVPRGPASVQDIPGAAPNAPGVPGAQVVPSAPNPPPAG